MKRFIALFMTIIMVFTMAACAGSEDQQEESVSGTETEAEAETGTDTETGEKSIYDLTVDELMSSITNDMIYDYVHRDTEVIATLLNNAAGKTVSEEEGKANKLDPAYADYDSRVWECEFSLIDYDEDEDIVTRNSVKPGMLTLYCNWYSDLVCVIVEDHNYNRKVEYYNDKDLYEFVRHSGDIDGTVDEEAYKKYQKWFDKAETSSLKGLESDFGWTGKYDLIKFEKQWEFDSSDGKGTVEIYAFEYAFTLDDFSKYHGGAGGMRLDGDMRVVTINPMYGQLAFKVVDGEAVDVLYIGNDWSVDFDPENNDEESITNQKQEVERLLKQENEGGTW